MLWDPLSRSETVLLFFSLRNFTWVTFYSGLNTEETLQWPLPSDLVSTLLHQCFLSQSHSQTVHWGHYAVQSRQWPRPTVWRRVVDPSPPSAGVFPPTTEWSDSETIIQGDSYTPKETRQKYKLFIERVELNVKVHSKEWPLSDTTDQLCSAHQYVPICTEGPSTYVNVTGDRCESELCHT